MMIDLFMLEYSDLSDCCGCLEGRDVYSMYVNACKCMYIYHSHIVSFSLHPQLQRHSQRCC